MTIWYAAKLQVYVTGKYNSFKHCASSGMRWTWVITDGTQISGADPTTHGSYYRRHATKKEAAEEAAKLNESSRNPPIVRILNLTCQPQVKKYAPKVTP